MRIITPTAAVNAAVAGARSLPALIANLRTIDPALATQLESKPLLASKSPWGTLLVAAVAWLSARYGLGLDDTTTDLVAGAGLVLGSYLMRWLTRRPIAGVLATPAGVPPAPGTEGATPSAPAAGIPVSVTGAPIPTPIFKNPN